MYDYAVVDLDRDIDVDGNEKRKCSENIVYEHTWTMSVNSHFFVESDITLEW